MSPAAGHALPAIAALVLDREGRARIQDALRGRATVQFVDEGRELLAILRRATIAAIIVEARDRAGVAISPLVRAIRDGFPSIALIGYGRLSSSGSGEVLALARAGVDELIIYGCDDVGIALRSAVEQARERRTAAQVLTVLDDVVPPTLQPFVAFCLEHARQATSVSAAARALGVHRKTLVNRARQAGVAEPSRLLGWCRLLAAAPGLADPFRSVEQVALESGFTSATAFRNMLKRYSGLTPTVLREAHGTLRLMKLAREAISAKARR
ncbi:MAG TPA: helix-turn-helix domain-containing protein [Gemmatimonadaceae bacterium]|nr:helix-turn-helix domain-containing protein [Gemmatimonadaceae bacterium]